MRASSLLISVNGFMLRSIESANEWQVIFGVALAKHKTKSAIAFANREFAKWAADNEDLL